MLDSELQSKIIEMLPVVIGGVIAVTGSVSASMLSHLLESRRSKKMLVAEKAERLVKILFKNMSWLMTQYSGALICTSRPELPEYIHVAQMIQSIYFPCLRADVYSISYIHCDLYDCIGRIYQKRMSDKDYQTCSEEDDNFEKLLKEYKDRLLLITEQCRSYTIK